MFILESKWIAVLLEQFLMEQTLEVSIALIEPLEV